MKNIFRIKIIVRKKLKNKVEGLCGTFNDDISDDLMTSEGSVSDSLENFISSWTSDENMLVIRQYLHHDI